MTACARSLQDYGSRVPPDAGGGGLMRDPGAVRRRLLGAELVPGGVHFRVWAPERRRVEVRLEGAASVPMRAEEDGYWSGFAAGARAGARYRFGVDDDETGYPDPASRYQPDGPHGPSEVVDPTLFAWSDASWSGLPLAGQVIYELHVGTFCPEGTWDGARAKLPLLREVGVTTVEVMPVADFGGTFGWGYDGVNLFAPTRLYGRPDDFRRFVDDAHRLGMAVILDVVYNHLGPDGNYLRAFSSSYFGSHGTEWGEAINYDGENSAAVRALYTENAAYWIAEFHLDGLRLDATQSIVDTSERHVLEEIGRRAREAAGARTIVVIAENEPQHTRLVRRVDDGGYGLDGLWNDDFHHSALVALTGHNEAYYSGYRGTSQELLSAVKHGYLYQGQNYRWQKQRRGSSTRGLPARTFVAFLENHDQLSNSCAGERTWRLSHPGQHRAMTTLLALGPWTPMLFQGQEWSASAPFRYFADFEGELRTLVGQGRADFLSQFPSCVAAENGGPLPEPCARTSFERCRLDWTERDRPLHAAALALHADLFALRRSDPVIRAQASDGVTLDGAVLSDDCLVIRFFAPSPSDDRLLVVNLGRDLDVFPGAEPLLAPAADTRWAAAFSSEHPRYGGGGMPNPEARDGVWRAKGHAATLLKLVSA
jgi:maltooligosyltrehalose trehalohydrolase